MGKKLTPEQWERLDRETKLRLKHGWDEFSMPIVVKKAEDLDPEPGESSETSELEVDAQEKSE